MFLTASLEQEMHFPKVNDRRSRLGDSIDLLAGHVSVLPFPSRRLRQKDDEFETCLIQLEKRGGRDGPETEKQREGAY